MRLVIAAIGRRRHAPEAVLIDGYAERLAAGGRAVGLHGLDLAEFDAARAPDAAGRAAREWTALSGAVPPGARTVVLDERGKAFGSADFAALIARWRDDGAPATAFLIGGPDGHAPAARESADLLLAFGPWTWPHLLVRAMLAEQLYRTMTILAGHPYHRS